MKRQQFLIKNHHYKHRWKIFKISGSGSGLEKIMDPNPDPVCHKRLDPDLVCPERLDPVNIRPHQKL